MKEKVLLLIIIIGGLISCTNTKTDVVDDNEFGDSIGNRSVVEIKDSIKKDLNKRLADQVYGDTIGVYKSPVKVLKSRMVKEEYSRFRDIELTFKNVSDKKIVGIRFSWKGVNAFGEPADMGNSLAEGYGSGFTDTPLRPGKTTTAKWSILSRDGKKVLYAWAYEVAFEDGTVWKLKK
jgi:hypothetical protein